MQCGFCTPAWSWRVTDLLDRSPRPSELEMREAISGNLCRCTGYGRIFAAVPPACRGGACACPRLAVPATVTRRRRGARPRRERAAPDGAAQGQGRVRVLLRPVRRRHGLGQDAASARTRTRASSGSTSAGALAMPGVHAVVTARRRAGAPARTGWSTADQPVFADDVVRFHGEPIAAVAADHPETRRPRLRRHRGRVRGARPAGGRRGGDHGAADPPRRQRLPRTSGIRHGDPDGDRRRGRRGHLRGGHAGPGLPRPGVGAGRARARTAASSCSSRPSGCTSTATRSPPASTCPGRRCGCPSPASAAPSAGARTCRMQIHACLLALRHRPAGEDGLHPRGVVLRPRPPAPGEALVPPPRPARRHAGQRRVPDGLRRRRLHVVEHRGHRQRDAASPPGRTTSRTRWSTATRCGRTTRRAARCAASVRCRPASPHEAQMDKLAAALRDGPGRAAPAERAGDRTTSCSPVRSSRAPRRSQECIRACAGAAAAAGRGPGRRPDDAARRRRPDGAVARRAARRRLRGRVQEPRLLRGLRRLLVRPGPARARRRRRAGGHRARRHRRGRPGLRDPRPADRPGRARGRLGRAAPGRHPGRLGRLHQRVAADHDERRGGADGLRRRSARWSSSGRRWTCTWRRPTWCSTTAS